MAYSFDPIFAADPSNPTNVASNAAITIYNPNDAGKAPVTITDVSDSPLANPITVNKNGFGPAFKHATLDRLAWAGGGFSGFFTSYEGIKNEAVAARQAAETAGADAAAAAAVGVADVADNAAAAEAAATEAAASAAASAALVGAPADSAIAAAINGTGTATKAALDTTIGTALTPKLDKTAAATTYALQGPPAKRGTLVPVATRTALTYMRAQSNGTDTQETARVSHIITADCFNLRLAYGNISSNGNAISPVDGPSTITVRCDVEDAAGKRKRGWAPNGGRSLVIEPGGHGFFEVQGSFKKGDRIYTRTHVSVTAGGKWPRGMTTNTGAQAGIGEGVTVGADLTLPSTTAVTQSFTWVYSPAMILGNVATPAPTVAQVGDSIAASQSDAADLGFIIRALNGNFGYISVAQQGETTGMFNNADEGGGRAFGLDYVSHAICEYGVNDIFNNNSTLAGWQSASLTLWTGLARRGIKVFQTTITPKSTSTDSWATTANQTAATQTSVRNSANDWIRAGAPIDPTTKAAVAIGTAGALLAGTAGHPLTGYFEVADLVESARNSGLWKVNGTANYMTSDGTHPSSAAHQLLAPGIDTSKLTL